MPKHASTVILLRPTDADDYEVLLVRRHRKSAFMGDTYVFPGGKLDDADADEALLAHLPPALREACVARIDPTPGRAFDRRTAVGLYVAALRELYEEVGVLLATNRATGEPVAISDPAAAERFAAHRRKLGSGTAKIADFLAQEDLLLGVDQLVYWAHWVTPSIEPRRYDTRFFLARMPDAQIAASDGDETTDAVWMTPRAACLGYSNGTMLLSPPTLRNLEDLSAYRNIASLMDTAAQRPVAAILPKIVSINGTAAILLPWDPLYATSEGEGLYDLAHPHPLAGGPSRLVLEGERWASR